MKALKIAGIAVAVIVLLIAAGLAALFALFDGARVKAEIAKVVLEQKQRTLTIAGDVELAVWPKVAIKVGKVSLSEHKSPQEFLSLDGARVAVAVMPLLARQVVVDAVEIDGLSAQLIRRRDGTLNIADLMGGPPAAGQKPAEPLAVDVAGVRINNARLNWIDEKAGVKSSLSDLDFSTGRLQADTGKASYQAEKLSVAAKGRHGTDSFDVRLESPRLAYAPQGISGDAVSLKGKIDGAGRTLDLDLATGRLQADTVKTAFQAEKLAVAAKGKLGDKHGTESFDLRLEAPRLSGNAQGAAGESVSLKGTLAGAGRSADLDLAAQRVQTDFAKQTYQVDKLQLAAKGKLGTDAFEAKIDAPRLAITPQSAAGDAVSLVAKLAGNGRTVDAKATLAGVEGNAQALKIARLGLELDAKVADTAAKGRLDTSLAANLAAKTLALDRIDGKLDLAHPRMPMKQVSLPLAGSLRADLAKSSAAADLSTRFDDSKIALKLDIARFEPLSAGFDLDIDRLNLDKYLPPKKADEKTAAPDAKIDLSALKGPAVRGNLRIGSLQANNLKLANLSARLNLAGGRADIAPLSASLYQGTLTGSVAASADQQFALKQTLTGVAVQPLMKDLLDKDMLEGRGNVSVDVTARGDTVTALKKALAGSAAINLKDGAIKGINLAKSLRELKTKFGAKQDATQANNAAEKTDFSELSASFRIAGGVARNDDLAMKSPFIRLGGAGDIDIGNGRLDYLAKASVVTTAAGQGGQDLAHLKGLTIPVRLSGPFESPSWKIEFGNMVGEAVKEAAKVKVDEKKQEIKQKAEDKVKDQLKGLFRK